MPERDLATCKGCGRQIRWARIAGKNVPLDVSAPVYLRTRCPDSREEFWALDTPTESVGPQALVNHFAVCSARDQFKGRS